MKPNAVLHLVTTSPVTESAAFGISQEDTAHIMSILRSTLYSDKILAVLREYSSNAWDAHRSVGKHDLPISVTLPNTFEPTLSIRDYGPGMSPDEVFHVYTQYGASTKRDSDDFVGAMGIGSKSGFAYADSFTITSWHAGTKNTYVAVLDASEKGAINLLHSENCGDETGICIQIAVAPKDLNTFERRAADLYPYFEPTPAINIAVEAPDVRYRSATGDIHPPQHYSWRAAMGCVVYPVDRQQLEGLLPTYAASFGGLLRFNIGDIEVSASRESLKYSDTTKQRLVNKFNTLLEEFVRHTLDTINNATTSPWEKRLAAQVLKEIKLNIVLSADQAVFMDSRVEIKHTASEFNLGTRQGGTYAITHIPVTVDTRLVLKDTRKSAKHFYCEKNDYIILPQVGVSTAQVQASLDIWCIETQTTGIPIVLLSSLQEIQNTTVPRTQNRFGTKQQRFILSKTNLHGTSDDWEVVNDAPSPTDVYVVLDSFRVQYSSSFSRDYVADTDAMRYLGGTMPKIYGYRNTKAKPATPATCTGIPYENWRNEFIPPLLTPVIRADFDSNWWAALFTWRVRPYESDCVVPANAIANAAANLGQSHPIVTLLELASKLPTTPLGDFTLARRCTELKIHENVAQRTYTYFTAHYPLLSTLEHHLVYALNSINQSQWYEYIRAIDELKGVLQCTFPTP